MPLVNQSDITDVRLGTTEAGALLAGDKLVWNRRVAVSEYSGAGSYTLQVPSWANFMTVLLVGGGSSGIPQEGIFRLGRGGAAGETELIGSEVRPHTRIDITVGSGGSGGLYIKNQNPGNVSRIRFRSYTNTVLTRTAAGGQGPSTHATVMYYGDGTLGISPNENKYVIHHTGGEGIPAGKETEEPKNTSRDGVRGAGGTGSTGGVGSGGDGYAQVVFFGVDPLIEINSGTPDSSGGRFRGEWVAGVQYVEGDTFTFQKQRFRVKQAHTSSSGASPAAVDIPGIAQSYYERI